MSNVFWTHDELKEWNIHVKEAVKHLNSDPENLKWGELKRIGEIAMSKMNRQRCINFRDLRKTLGSIKHQDKMVQANAKTADNEIKDLLYLILEQLEAINENIQLQTKALEQNTGCELKPTIQTMEPKIRLPKVIVIGANTDQAQSMQEHFKDTLEIRAFEASRCPSAKLLKGYALIVIMSKFNKHTAFDNARVAEKAGSILLVATGGTTRTIEEITEKAKMLTTQQ
jgi:hypothetical protein